MPTAEEIRAFMKRYGLTVRRLASEVGVDKSTVDRWLNHGRVPDRFREAALLAVMRRYESEGSDS